jgi:hypothetical protein
MAVTKPCLLSGTGRCTLRAEPSFIRTDGFLPRSLSRSHIATTTWVALLPNPAQAVVHGFGLAPLTGSYIRAAWIRDRQRLCTLGERGEALDLSACP